jgi:hypothetical protein
MDIEFILSLALANSLMLCILEILNIYWSVLVGEILGQQQQVLVALAGGAFLRELMRRGL